MHLVDSAKGAELSAFFCGPFLGRKDSLKNLDFGEASFFGLSVVVLLFVLVVPFCWSFRCSLKFLWSHDSSVWSFEVPNLSNLN